MIQKEEEDDEDDEDDDAVLCASCDEVRMTNWPS